MITERVMPIAMFLFFIMIGINGFIIVAGGLQDTTGTSLSSIMGGGISQLGSDLNGQAGSITYNPSGEAQATTSTSAGFNIWDITTYWGGATDTVSNLIGIKNVYLINNAIFGIEQYMDVYILLFPGFEAIFLSIKFFVLGIKLLVASYAGTILVRAIVGRGVF